MRVLQVASFILGVWLIVQGIISESFMAILLGAIAFIHIGVMERMGGDVE